MEQVVDYFNQATTFFIGTAERIKNLISNRSIATIDAETYPGHIAMHFYTNKKGKMLPGIMYVISREHMTEEQINILLSSK